MTPLREIDAGTFQDPLFKLARTLSLKVDREGPGLKFAPDYVSVDLFALIRQATFTCKFFFYLNADERRAEDTHWDTAYTFVAAPLVRTIIDCLYNITYILQAPRSNGKAFRQAGYRKELEGMDSDEKKYSGQSDWDDYFKEKRNSLSIAMRQNNLLEAEIRKQEPWKTLGQYLNQKGKGGSLTPHQAFLQTFTYGIWREYSAMLHGGFDGLLPSAAYFMRDAQKFEIRERMDEVFPQQMSLHMSRAAGILICILTEIQGHFKFKEADIDARLHRLWNALMPVYEIKELYDDHYEQFMAKRRIKP